jgi:signal transduction histidine kinase
MDEDIKQQLFARFFSTKGSKGTGLGLLVTQKIVQEHGGVLSVNSEPGKGSTFTMVLPQKHEDS